MLDVASKGYLGALTGLTKATKKAELLLGKDSHVNQCIFSRNYFRFL